MASVPAHKQHIWVPVVYEGSGDQESVVIEPEQVRVVRTPPPLDRIKSDLCRAIDADAERTRLRYITPGDGMQMVYAEKFAQAQAVRAMGQTAADALTPENGTAQFPTLSASVGLEAATLWDCAVLVLAKYTQFAQLSNGIERKRLTGKKAVAAATDVASAQAAYEAVIWMT